MVHHAMAVDRTCLIPQIFSKLPFVLHKIDIQFQTTSHTLGCFWAGR